MSFAVSHRTSHGENPDEPQLGTADGIPYSKPIYKPPSQMTWDEWEWANDESDKRQERV